MIGYATVGTNDIDRARDYYDALFGSIGAQRIWQFPENGFTMWGTSPGRPGLAVTLPYDGGTASPGNGAMVGLVVESREQVDAFHAKALALGGTCEGKPGLRTAEGDEAFYGAYFRDPDSNKFCVFRIGSA